MVLDVPHAVGSGVGGAAGYARPAVHFATAVDGGHPSIVETGTAPDQAIGGRPEKPDQKIETPYTLSASTTGWK
ncbi:hypothetical protein Acsp01_60630 [Actinoplanes sp. NBRC 101535]|nr:hypothetical protein Acsp01_60630 [Actinoplanes sp. NBRC 101535]